MWEFLIWCVVISAALMIGGFIISVFMGIIGLIIGLGAIAFEKVIDWFRE